MNVNTPTYHLSEGDRYSLTRDLNKSAAVLRMTTTFLDGGGDLMTGAADVIDLAQERLMVVTEDIDLPPGNPCPPIPETQRASWVSELLKVAGVVRFMADRIDYETPGRSMEGVAEVLELTADKIKSCSEFLEPGAFVGRGAITTQLENAS